MCDTLARRKGKEKVPSAATIMASRLCENCKTIHPKPWDNKCKFRATEATEEGEINNDNSENVANAQASGPPMDPQMKLYAELLATVKTLSSQVASYDTRLSELSQSMSKKSPTERPKHAKASADETLFGGTRQHDAGGSKGAQGGGARPKNRHPSTSGNTPPAKVVKL